MYSIAQGSGQTPIQLSVYKLLLNGQDINMPSIGMGIYHSAVQIENIEVSFGGNGGSGSDQTGGIPSWVNRPANIGKKFLPENIGIIHPPKSSDQGITPPTKKQSPSPIFSQVQGQASPSAIAEPQNIQYHNQNIPAPTYQILKPPQKPQQNDKPINQPQYNGNQQLSAYPSIDALPSYPKQYEQNSSVLPKPGSYYNQQQQQFVLPQPSSHSTQPYKLPSPISFQYIDRPFQVPQLQSNDQQTVFQNVQPTANTYQNKKS
ncbi:MAG: hypothetical protein EZS28_025425 [Streblomastix strix]|uniref:Uncharacterized protein n=1 Tax=Streblomastix strix TaxID=222440 RepID=A0A5J4V941_9EUKA|nr:MAG: hypothetical protein EZS28_025425 [Streblomastix strix]